MLQYHCEHNKNPFQEQKQKLVEYMRNYDLEHKKQQFSCLIRFFNNPRTI